MSTAGYHEHVARRALDAPRQHLSDEVLLVRIRAIHAETHGAYGWPRVWKEPLARGFRVGKERVQELMQRHGIPFYLAKGWAFLWALSEGGCGDVAAPNTASQGHAGGVRQGARQATRSVTWTVGAPVRERWPVRSLTVVS